MRFGCGGVGRRNTYTHITASNVSRDLMRRSIFVPFRSNTNMENRPELSIPQVQQSIPSPSSPALPRCVVRGRSLPASKRPPSKLTGHALEVELGKPLSIGGNRKLLASSCVCLALRVAG